MPDEPPDHQRDLVGSQTPDGMHHDSYDPATLDVVLGEAAHLLRALGFAAQHAVLIGGVVPSLLVLDPPGPRHVGTGDLDLCLSLALVDGDTAEYERIETALTRAGYQPTDVSFRWRRRGLDVEFFCPAGPDRDRIGPSSYARFLSTDTTTRDDRIRLTRRAAGAVNELRDELGGS